ncbi:DUF223 domain-containing protein [Raphanus sativus]|nr:DUF223 domain-containing protein [Raphanus sativus]
MALGVQIHCTCKKVFLARVKKLQIGQWRILQNFLVCQAVGIYRPTSHKFKICITDYSIVTNSSFTTCEVGLIDQNNESSSEAVSTRFCKRKEGDSDINDMNHTSKKLCAKNIKMEKTEDY